MDKNKKLTFVVTEFQAGPRMLAPADTETREYLGELMPNARIKLQLSVPPRSNDQNALMHAIQTEVQRQTDWSKDEIEEYCKLMHGVPILLAQDADFAKRWDELVYRTGMTYELQLKLMRWLAVTRLMSKKQMTDYIDATIMDFSSQGYVITLPGDSYGN